MRIESTFAPYTFSIHFTLFYFGGKTDLLQFAFTLHSVNLYQFHRHIHSCVLLMSLPGQWGGGGWGGGSLQVLNAGFLVSILYTEWCLYLQ